MCSDSLRDKSVAKPRNECRQSSLAVIFKSVVLAKILYASPAWWGWANSSDTDRLEAFLRRCTRLQLYRQCDPTVNQLVEDMEDKLFTSVINNDKHVLSHILPEPVLCCFAFLLRCCVLTVNFTHWIELNWIEKYLPDWVFINGVEKRLLSWVDIVSSRLDRLSLERQRRTDCRSSTCTPPHTHIHTRTPTYTPTATMSLYCTISEILSLISQNIKRSRDSEHIPFRSIISRMHSYSSVHEI